MWWHERLVFSGSGNLLLTIKRPLSLLTQFRSEPFFYEVMAILFQFALPPSDTPVENFL